MGAKHLSYFKVENFKRFDSLEVNDIGQFNLIVGDNNVGKTTLLEALLIDEANYDSFLASLWTMLVQNRNIFPKDINAINFLDFYNNRTSSINYMFRYASDKKDHTLKLSKRINTSLSRSEIETLGSVYVLNQSNKHLIEFDLDGTPRLKYTVYSLSDGYMPFIQFNLGFTEDLINYFSKIILSNSKFEELKKSLRFFIPNLISIELNSAMIDGQNTIAVREEGKDNLQPLTQYGDGTEKLFRYLLEFESCTTDRMMIDEIDTGIHYSRMKDFLKKMIRTAKDKNVQIFATTHSKECLEYYREALQELKMEDEGRIIRLANTKSGIKAYTMRYEEFENALVGENEIR